MASTQVTPEARPLVWSPVAARGNVRKWRLHACACARRAYPKRGAKKWLAHVAVAERYADGDATQQEFDAAQTGYESSRRPKYLTMSGDFGLALQDSRGLRTTWKNVVITPRHEYTPDLPEYALVVGRFRVLEDLIGPDPLPRFDRAWRTDTAVAIARGMYDAREFSATPILADALQDAGCEDPVILDHCRNPRQAHFRGCWAVDLVLGIPQGPLARTPRPSRTPTRKATR